MHYDLQIISHYFKLQTHMALITTLDSLATSPQSPPIPPRLFKLTPINVSKTHHSSYHIGKFFHKRKHPYYFIFSTFSFRSHLFLDAALHGTVSMTISYHGNSIRYGRGAHMVHLSLIHTFFCSSSSFPTLFQGLRITRIPSQKTTYLNPYFTWQINISPII